MTESILDRTEWITRKNLKHCNGQEECDALEAALMLRRALAGSQSALTKAMSELTACREELAAWKEHARTGNPCHCSTCKFGDEHGCKEPTDRPCASYASLWEPKTMARGKAGQP